MLEHLERRDIPSVSQWASSVIGYSSQTPGPSFSAQQATSPPNVPTYGGSAAAWSPSVMDGMTEFVELGYTTPVHATEIRVRENSANGFITEVAVRDTTGALHVLWAGTDTTPTGSPADLVVANSATSYLVQSVKITITTNAHLGQYEQIDAVELKGAPAPAPTIASIAFGNATPKTNDTLTIQTAGVMDPNAVAVNFHYVWTVNGFTVRDVVSNEDSDWLELSHAGNGDKGDSIHVTVTPVDVYASGTALTASVIVVNSAPIAIKTDVTLGAYQQHYDGIEFLANVVDPDGDPVSLTILSNPQHGDLVEIDPLNHVYNYVATTGYKGIDTFTFSYSDGFATSQTVSCQADVYDDTTDFATDSYVHDFKTLYRAAFNGVPSGLDITQGSIGDCWFVAAAVGFAQIPSHQNSLQNTMIVDNGPRPGGGNSYTVTFPGKNAVTFVYIPGTSWADPSNAMRTMTFASTPNGDWIGILEQAWAYVNDPNSATWAQAIRNVLDPDNGRPSFVGINALTGSRHDSDSFWCTRDLRTRQKLQAAFANDKIMVAGNLTANQGLTPQHMYTILEYDAVQDRVRLRNPHGSNDIPFLRHVYVPGTATTPGGYQLSPANYMTAAFWMPLREFTRTFTEICYES